jgi:two-component system OmpR family sensor kinase
LGLSIVHAVVSSHGGKVTMHSVPGRTQFTVLLPMATPVAGRASHEYARVKP